MKRWTGVLLSLLAGEAAAGTVVINEFMPDPAGTDAGGEWVELLNTTSSSVDLSAWKLERAKSSWGAVYTFPSGTSLAGGARLVIGESRVTSAQISVGDGTLDLGNAGSNADGVRLVDASGTVRDVVVYGTPNSDALVDESGVAATSLAPKPASDKSLARVPDGVDTDRAGDDFKSGTSTPGATNGSGTGPGPDPVNCAATVGRVVINELLSDPEGTDSSALAEWVELFNAGSEQNLEGWKLERASQPGNYSAFFTFPAGAVARANGFVLVGEPNVSGATHVVPLIALYNGTSGDGVRLVDCGGRVADTVIYGGPNADAMLDDSGQVATSVAPKPPSGGSIGRLRDGVDTDQSGADFTIPTQKTPGSPNPVPPPCEPDTGVVVLNEFLPDPDGADGTALKEFVELYNNGTLPVSVSGWHVVGASGNTDVRPDFTFPSNAVIAPGGFLVVGEANVPEADFVATLLGLPNGSGGDAVRLLDCTGAQADSVVYGADNSDAIVDDNGQVNEPVAKPVTGKSIGRVEDGVDTEDITDWASLRSPSPGATNAREPSDTSPDTGRDPAEVRGCGSDAPEPGDDLRGCAVQSGRWPGMLAFGLLVAGMRRRSRARDGRHS